MKKVLAALLAVILLVSLLTACGASKGMSDIMAQPSGAPYPNPDMDEGSYDYAGKAESAPGEPQSAIREELGGTGSGYTGNSSVIPASQKMIFTVTADIETTKFDESMNNVNALMTAYGAYIESSYISGKNYADKFYGYETYRSASFTIRVPADKLTAMTDQLSTLGNVLSSNKQSQNITIQFIDSESRLKACRAEETSLLAMLEKADTVEVILAIQSRLTDVRYEIESLTSTLKNWQNQVDFSTVVLSIREVAELSEQQPPLQRTYWEEIRDGFNATLKGIGEFFKGLFKGIVIILPVLLILAVIAVVVIVIIRLVTKKSRAKGNQDMDRKE
jgi:hypothetical protein